MLASQGTWNFIATELLENPRIEHSFVHNLESFFYVLLYLSILYLPTTWDEGQCSDFLNSIIDIKHFGKHSKGGVGEKNFITSLAGMKKLAFTSNDPLKKLVYSFKDMLMDWYQAEITMPSFMSKEEYKLLKFKYKHVIDLFNQALSSDSWPEKDTRSLKALITPSISSVAIAQASSKLVYKGDHREGKGVVR